MLPKIEHDMLKEAGRQELVTVQQLCGAVLEKNPDVEQDFILGLRQPTKSWQEKGRGRGRIAVHQYDGGAEAAGTLPESGQQGAFCSPGIGSSGSW